ncbi:hypothetical protein [Nitrosomonas supralitoralis]|uniref:DUF968 domain-containing protein n=1 Tax=Nitrosomonas supralitoralis TaxID=2116706 RepID=A0A2P7NTU5_9PROT|nr:hypothetical protein [Nitrosomonas supralitoralis]PSJ16894.1 hypothetical protein C7H79_11060 [Nitrosomonas supralitoralis]
MSDVVAISASRGAYRETADGSLEVKIIIDPRFKDDFHRIFREKDMRVALAPLIPKAAGLDIHTTEITTKTPNRLAQAMHLDGYFRNPKLWTGMEIAEVYSQDDHKKVVETLPCCGTKFAKHINCDGDVVGHHVKTSSNSGVGIKPLHWYLVPLCHNHHMAWAHGSHAGSATHEDRHEVLLPHAVALTANQMKVYAKKLIGISSLSEITIDLLNTFEEEIFGEVVNKYE